jgi:hypothetical protein
MSLSVLLTLCPSCPPAIEARSLVLSEAFWINATYAMLPFAVVAVVVHLFVKRLDRGARHEG